MDSLLNVVSSSIIFLIVFLIIMLLVEVCLSVLSVIVKNQQLSLKLINISNTLKTKRQDIIQVIKELNDMFLK